MRGEIVFIILGMAAVTFITRGAGLFWHRFGKKSSSVERFLRPIPIAVLTALIVPAILLPQGELNISPGNPYLIAGLVATLTAIKTGSVIITVVISLSVMFILRWLGM